MPITAAAIGAGASLLGGFFGGKSSEKNAAKQMAFQERMRNTAHQAEVRDLRKAGLNPILSATGGAGAASPSGAQPQVPDYGGLAGEATRNVTSAIMQKKQLELLNAQISNTNTDTGKKAAETAQTVVNTQGKNWEIEKYLTDKPYWDVQAVRANETARTTLQQLQTNLESSKLSQTEQRQRVETLLREPEIQRWMLSIPYAERETIDRMISGGVEASDIIKFLMNLARR